MKMKTIAAALASALLLTALSGSAYADGQDCDRAFGARKNANACATESTVYFMCDESAAGGAAHSVIRYLDKATGVTGPLCGRPECAHAGSGCSAYAEGVIYGMAAYEGRLYWVALDGMNRYLVYSAAPDGTDRRTVRELDGDLVPRRMNDWSFQFHRGRVYLSCVRSTVEDGQLRESEHIAAWPLDPDQTGFLILDEELDTPQMSTQLYESGLYIFDTYRAAGKKSPPRFRRWDIETERMEVLFDGWPPFGGGISDCWVTEEGVYTVESHPVGDGQYQRSVYRYDLSGGTFERVSEWFTGGPCSVGLSDGLCVAVDSQICDRLSVRAADFQGNVLMDAELPTEGMPGGMTFLALYLAGADENNMYFYSTQPAFFAMAALDGSGARVLWP